MKSLHNTRAIVLKSRDLSEKDRIVTFISPRRGKFDAAGKGVKKLTGSTMGKMEPLNEVLLMIRPGRNLDTVAQAMLANGFPQIRSRLETTCAGLYMLDLVNARVEKDQECHQLFNHLRGCLYLLESGLNPDICACYFEARFAGILGYSPLLGECTLCRRQGNHTFFSPNHGSAICPNCRKAEKNLPGMETSPGTLPTLKSLMGLPQRMLFRVTIPRFIIQELRTLLGDHIDCNIPGNPVNREQYRRMGCPVTPR